MRKLEKYEIEEEIGHGGMATVYRAHDTVLDRPVALKVMHPHLRGAEEARRRFHREAQSVARLRHPRVLEIYDFSGEGSDEAYIAAELLTGPTLKKWREDQTEVPAEIAACFVIEIAKALEAAHDAKIVHRDVKPENVLLHQNRTIKLTDFGIADMVDAASMTATGQILGSPGHMAPEQIEGKDTDARSDLFSLGTVLYYLATGRLPFTGRNPHQILKRIVDAEFADPLRVNPTIGGRMRAIIIKSLEKDPANRFQSAPEFRRELEAFVREAGIQDPEQTLAAFLGDPGTAAVELRRETIDRLIDRGERASDAGDVPTALDCYNRVLALDEGNERVLRLIERVGMDRRRRTALFTGAGLIAFGLVAGGVAWAVWSQPPDPLPLPTPPIAGEPADAGDLVVSTTVDAAAPLAVDAATVLALADDAGPADAEDLAPRLAGDRLVRFTTNVPNMTVSIDGAPPQRFSLVSQVELPVGGHEIRLEPGDSAVAVYYRTTSVPLEVPRGAGVLSVRLQLALREGGVRVNCGETGARVVAVTTAGRGEGHCGESIAVPMPSRSTTVAITVNAPGREPYTVPDSPVITAGGMTVQITVRLPEPSPAAP